jgi:hypothetical protein
MIKNKKLFKKKDSLDFSYLNKPGLIKENKKYIFIGICKNILMKKASFI